MKVRWSPQAKADLEGLVRYIAADNLMAAFEVADRIVASVDRLSQFPRRGRPGKEPGTRELVVRGTPYLAVYRLAADVEVLRVLHGSQQWPPSQQ